MERSIGPIDGSSWRSPLGKQIALTAVLGRCVATAPTFDTFRTCRRRASPSRCTCGRPAGAAAIHPASAQPSPAEVLPRRPLTRGKRVARRSWFGSSPCRGRSPAERLLRRLGMPQGDDRILRHLKRHAAAVPHGVIRVAGIDDWSWRRGTRYGTVVVDLERRAVVDVLPDRSAATMTAWLQAHPSVEVVSRDRCGLYAQAARQGAPQALQVADRFHLVQNLRLAIERQLSRAPKPMKLENKTSRRASPPSFQQEQQDLSRTGRRLVWLDQFAAVKRPQQEGNSLAAIVTKPAWTGARWRSGQQATHCRSDIGWNRGRAASRGSRRC